MNSLCDKNEAQAFHPPEPSSKPTKGAALWAVSVILALAGAGAQIFWGFKWY